MHAAKAFNLSRLRSHSPSHRTCSLAVALHTRSHGLGLAEVHVGVDMTSNYHEIFKRTHLKFTVSGRSKQTNKRTSIDTHTLLQCSYASVGLTQARPNKHDKWYVCHWLATYSWWHPSLKCSSYENFDDKRSAELKWCFHLSLFGWCLDEVWS